MNNTDNYCVIIAGGVGKRFWPFSRQKYPKQFLDLFGFGQTLIQQTYNRFKKIIPKENILIVTNREYIDLLKEQIPELTDRQILGEPARRNTAPAITWACFHIMAENPNANIVVAPSDHLILTEDNFIKIIQKGLNFVKDSNKLLTLGIKPHKAETRYGYIQIDEKRGDNLYKVKTFIEKPQLEFAQIFIQSDEFYWNSGIFIWNVKQFIRNINTHLPELAAKFAPGLPLYGTEKEEEFIDEIFPTCQNISIDYSLMEKTEDLYITLGDFEWADLGSWQSLYELYEKDEENNATIKCKSLIYNSKDNLIALPEKKLAVIDGLEGYIVAEAGNVLIICKKDQEENIRKYINDVHFKISDDYI